MEQAIDVESRQIDVKREAGVARENAYLSPRGRLNHLGVLEAESIHILREAVAEFARPVMLYSIGKDSSVYPSVGCTHCTRPVSLGEDPRAGRWAGFAKTECGLHAKE